MSCLFCQIAGGQLPAAVVHADEQAVVFLDKAPLFLGHALVVPRAHVVTLAELPAEAVGPFFTRVQAIARAVQRGLGADGSLVAMNNTVSQSVPHLHVHVVPRRKKDGLRGFFWPRQKYESEAAMQDYAARIRAALPSS